MRYMITTSISIALLASVTSFANICQDGLKIGNVAVPHSTVGLLPGTAPDSSADILDKMILVHAFEKPAVQGIIEKNSRPTAHFAIGGLVEAHKFSWDNHRYALLRRLGNVIDQVVNLNVYDTFIVGELKLQKGDVIIGPREDRDLFPEWITYVESRGLRYTVETEIKRMGGWSINTNKRALDGIARNEDKTDVNSLDFWKPILKAYPHLSVGIHMHSRVGMASYFGLVDNLFTYLGGDTEMYKRVSNQDLLFRRILADHIGHALLRSYRKESIPQGLRVGLERFEERLKLSLQLVDFYVDLYRKQNVDVHEILPRWMKMLDKPQEIRAEMKWLKNEAAKLHSMPNLMDPNASDSTVQLDGVRVAYQARYAFGTKDGILNQRDLFKYMVPAKWSDVAPMLDELQSLFPDLDMDQFVAAYVSGRSVLVGIQQADREGLWELLRARLATATPQARLYMLNWANTNRLEAFKGVSRWSPDSELEHYGRLSDYEQVGQRLLDAAKIYEIYFRL